MEDQGAQAMLNNSNLEKIDEADSNAEAASNPAKNDLQPIDENFISNDD